MSKLKVKKVEERVSVRIKKSTKVRASEMLKELNNNPLGRTVKFEDLCEMAVSLVTSVHLNVLQEKSLSNEDRKELLRQKYIAKNGPITKDDWTGFIMTAQFQEFLKAQTEVQVAA